MMLPGKMGSATVTFSQKKARSSCYYIRSNFSRSSASWEWETVNLNSSIANKK